MLCVYNLNRKKNMKKLFLAVAICSLGNVFAQQNEITFHNGVFVSDAYVKATDANFKGMADAIKDELKPGLGHSFTLGYRRSVGTFKIEAGLSYVKFSQKVNFSGIAFGNQINPQTGFGYTTTENPDKYKYDYKFFDIPLSVYYAFGKTKLKPFASVGINNYVYLNSYSHVSNSSYNNSYYNTYSLGAHAVLGARYDIGSKFMAEIGFKYQQFVTGVIQNKPKVQERFYGAGVNIGIGYKL